MRLLARIAPIPFRVAKPGHGQPWPAQDRPGSWEEQEAFRHGVGERSLRHACRLKRAPYDCDAIRLSVKALHLIFGMQNRTLVAVHGFSGAGPKELSAESV